MRAAAWVPALVVFGAAMGTWVFWPAANPPVSEPVDRVGQSSLRAPDRADVGRPNGAGKLGSGGGITTATPPAAGAARAHALSHHRAYNSAADLRVFAEQMKRRTEPGSGLYAWRAVNHCMVMTPLLKPDALEKLRRDVASELPSEAVRRASDLAWAETQCAGFTAAEMDLPEEQLLLRWGAQRDPLAMLWRRGFELQGLSLQSRQEFVGELLATGDPWLLRMASQALSEVSGQGATLEVHSYLDGRQWGGLLDYAQYSDAWRLATCAFAQDCHERDDQVRLACAFEGRCSDSVTQDVQRQAASEAAFANTQRVANRLVEVIKSADAKALSPPPPPAVRP